MRKLTILHAADLHLDSPFEGLSAGKAAIRRKEQRELLARLAELAASERVDLVLLAGDLLDSGNTFYETGEELIRALRGVPAPVFIAPGNHDYYSAKSPYARLRLPDNVHVFTEPAIRSVVLPELHARVYGAAFTEPSSRALLEGFRCERAEGTYNILCLHGELTAKDSRYNPITVQQLENSNLDYAALGHIHKASGLQRAGSTWYSWPGCPEGRGFDETGEKTVSIVTLDGSLCELRTVCIAKRRYEIVRLDMEGEDPLLAIPSRLPDDTVGDVYRIVLTGETDTPPDLRRLYENLSDMFFELQLRDETRLRRSVWDSAGEDTLRGLFLSRLRERFEKAHSEEERIRVEQAARWGLAALDNAEEVVQHDDP